jgi:NADPH-dependent F420 reductase
VIGIVGGSGDFGQGVAGRLRAHGIPVVIGSRTPRDEYVSNAECAGRSDVVFLSIPAGSVEATARDLAEQLAGKIVVSVAAAVTFRDGRPVAEPGPISLAEIAQRELPDARVVSALHTVSAKLLARVEHDLDEDVLMCGDDDAAKAEVGELIGLLVAGRAVDCGPLVTSRCLETLTVALLNANRRYRANTGIRITGLP